MDGLRLGFFRLVLGLEGQEELEKALHFLSPWAIEEVL